MRLGSELYRMGLFLQLFCLFYRMNDHPQSDIPKPENTGLLDQILNYLNAFIRRPQPRIYFSAVYGKPVDSKQLFKKQLTPAFTKSLPSGD